MSNETQKADQIAHRFYTKLTLVVNHARATLEPPLQVKVDKWFNLETPDPDLLKEHTRIYRSISSSVQQIPAFKLEVLLSIPDLTNNQVLVYLAPDSSRLRIDPTPKFILLESWDLIFSPNPAHYRAGDDHTDVAPSTMYKHGIPLFRSVFTLLRILPSWKLARRLRRRTGGSRNGNFSIQLRVQGVDEGSTLRFDKPPAPGASPLPRDSHAFPPISHPTGTFTLSVTYLTSPKFQLDELESLLSSRFLSLDGGPEFTPTLVKNQQRESLSGSPGSLPNRISLPHSPPSSVAERFIVPPPMTSRTTTFPTVGGSSPRMQSMALPSVRRPSNAGIGAAGSVSGMSDGSSSRHGGASIGSRDEVQSVSALAARLRRESTGAGRSTDLSASPGPVPIRRPPAFPFKSPALSSGSPSLHSPSPSLRQHSPLGSLPSGGPSLPSRPSHTSPTSSRVGVSAVSTGNRPPSSPVTSFRPSPPFAPSSLGDRRSLASADGGLPGVAESPRMTSGKRYSSSFGHRYAATGGVSSEGSAGSGAREGERVASASFLSTNTDDDDISAFVQDIDARRPLGGVREQSAFSEEPPEEERVEVSRPSSLHSRSRTMSTPMLATESAVDERLREMNDAFMSSLRGLGGRRRARGNISNEGRRTGGLLGSGGRPEGSNAESDREDSGGIPLPAAYVRQRHSSTASVRSGFSIASGEVIGRMDPEVADDTGRSAR